MCVITQKKMPSSSTSLFAVRKTSKFSCITVITLQEAAIAVLSEADVVQKAQRTMTYARSWQAGIICSVSDDFSVNMDCPAEPSRPVSNDSMKPLLLGDGEDEAAKTKKLKTMYKKNTVECTIHAIANAESYAIDLFWDLIARYTVSHSPGAAFEVRI